MWMHERKTIDLEQGWELIQMGITKLKNILEGLPEEEFSTEDDMTLFMIIYDMCTQKPLMITRNSYTTSIGSRLRSTSLRQSLLCLVKLGLLASAIWYVYQEIYFKARDAVISLVNQEREGEQIDRALLKNVLDIFVEIGWVRWTIMTSKHTCLNALQLIILGKQKAGFQRTPVQAEECLKQEKDRVSHYLHSSSEPKLLEKVQNELLSVYARKVLEKDHSGCRPLLRDDKVDDLSWMYGLFCKINFQDDKMSRLLSEINHGLDPIAEIFKQAAEIFKKRVTAEGTALVKQAEDVANNKKAEKKDLVGLQEQVFVRKIIELHDKYLAYVNDCFQNHSLFHKALKEAFEVFCNKGVAGSASAELLATFCDNILKKGGSEKLSDEAIEETLRKKKLLEIEHSGCHALLQDDKVDDLSRMYRLFSKINRGLDPIAQIFKQVAQIFKQHVTAEGTALVKQAEDAANNKKALKEAFEVFCNKGVAGSASAELLATLCDNILKKGGSEKLSDEAIEETLEKVVKLLAYISDKDLFAEFYRKKLARRLLFDKSANDDHERSILTKLKQQCGGQFTSKMEGMVTDLTLARENQSSFEEYLNSNPLANPGIDLTVTVLTTGFWPSYKSFDLNLPAEMVKCVEVFKEFYQTKTKHRKLTWIYSLGTCNINGKFEPKTIELIVTTYQAAALLLFNASDRLSYSEIMSQLNLSDDDVIRLLHSLSCAKYKILNKEPNTKNISPTDYFEFNSKFTDKMRTIKIPLPPVDEKKKLLKMLTKTEDMQLMLQ
uniref:Cullin family profile domain-containing protein n=1 Tax=Ananas comosus var. bracteatus TaxID=296719 RepID=A0A6V7PC16_ANACO|nr:unnamed protein product [Ananas comosus var. bracteatus]